MGPDHSEGRRVRAGRPIGPNRRGGTMPEKSPQKHNAKKVGKSLKEKRADKKAKTAEKRPLT